MRFAFVASAFAIAAGIGAVYAPALAGASLFATEAAAQAACQPDEVVFIDLDRGKFYHKAQAAYGKSSNGGYACLKAAHAQYRESHD